MSGTAHFFMSVGGSNFHERLAHFFIDIYKQGQKELKVWEKKYSEQSK